MAHKHHSEWLQHWRAFTVLRESENLSAKFWPIRIILNRANIKINLSRPYKTAGPHVARDWILSHFPSPGEPEASPAPEAEGSTSQDAQGAGGPS